MITVISTTNQQINTTPKNNFINIFNIVIPILLVLLLTVIYHNSLGKARLLDLNSAQASFALL